MSIRLALQMMERAPAPVVCARPVKLMDEWLDDLIVESCREWQFARDVWASLPDDVREGMSVATLGGHMMDMARAGELIHRRGKSMQFMAPE